MALPYNFLKTCANEVAEFMRVNPRFVCKWAAEYLATGFIAIVPRLTTNKPLAIRIENGRALSMEHILECLEVISKRKGSGRTTDSTVLHNHLMSSTRETCSIDLLPPCDVTCAAILDAMKTYGGVRWGKIKRSGRAAADATDDGAEKRLFSMDESYIHKGHMRESGLLFTDQDGNVITRFETAGKGNRVCMAGCISPYGHIVTTRDGEYVTDCAWLNSKLMPPTGNQQPRFVELNNQGQARDIYVQQMSGASLADFVKIAKAFKIPTENKDLKVLKVEVAHAKAVSS